MEHSTKLRNMTAIYLIHKDRILLLHRHGSKVVDNQWVGSAGGHFEENELNNPKACVLRELKEELSITEDRLSDLQLRYIVFRRTESEIRQNYYFFAHLDQPFDLVSNEGKLQWFDFSQVSGLNMPLSAKCSIAHYSTVGMHNDRIYVGIVESNGVSFTELPAF